MHHDDDDHTLPGNMDRPFPDAHPGDRVTGWVWRSGFRVRPPVHVHLHTHGYLGTPTTAAPTATVTPLPLGTIACPTMISPDGSAKIFTDPPLGFSFAYPAAWTENICQQGATGVLIGNLFSVSLTPRQGRTIAQWVDATKTPEETVTLTPLTDPHAVEVVQVTVTFPNGPGPTPEAFQPLVRTFAIVAGTQTFYSVNALIVQMNMTDTIPNRLDVQPGQPIVSTFTVS